MVVNGNEMAMPGSESATLLGLVTDVLKLEPGAVAIEMNGTIPPRESWANVQLSPADRIEIVRFVGGG